MDFMKRVESIEDLLGYIHLRWSIDVFVDDAVLSLRPIQNEPLAPWYDIVKFRDIKSVVQVLRQKYGIADDVFREHGSTGQRTGLVSTAS